MTDRRQRDLADSFRLPFGDEQWFLRDLAVGAVAFAVWVAGTGALATRAGDALGLALGGSESPSTVAVAVFGLLWLVVPAVAVAVRIRGRTRNIRGNVEQYYRLDHPAALLAPPAVLVAVVAVAAFALGTVPWYFAFALVPVGLFLLVRTVAFSHRVYAFSYPLVVQAFVAISTAVAIGGTFATVAATTGRGPAVIQVLGTVGVPGWLAGDVSLATVTVTGPLLATHLPVVLAAAYVLVQSVVALGVRLIEPDVDRSAMRTGQRYPPFLETATPMRTVRDAGEDGGSGATDSQPTADGPATDPTAADDDTRDEPGDEEEPEDDLDDVSNTRVFTPPADAGDASFDGGPGGTAGETRTAASTAADREDAESGHAESGGDRERCDACGESVTVDTSVRFCPNCGAALDGD